MAIVSWPSVTSMHPMYKQTCNINLRQLVTRLQHRSPSQCSRSNFVMDDCKSSNSELLQDWISAHWSQQTTCQNQQLLTHHHPLCSKPRLHIWWTPHFFWPDLICLQILLFRAHVKIASRIVSYRNCFIITAVKLDSHRLHKPDAREVNGYTVSQ